MFYFYEYFMFLVSILTVIGILKISSERKPPILNVYQQASTFYWIKVCFMFVILSLKKLKKTKIDIGELECPQKLSYSKKPIDAVYFNAASKIGDHFVIGTARRKNGLIDGFIYLKIDSSGLGILESPKLPSTTLYQEEEKEEYSAEGIQITMIKPMRAWKVEYVGKMKNSVGVLFDVQIAFEYTSDMPWFNFDDDIDSWCMAKCLAKEKWSSDYFKVLKTIHQTHYEQPGITKGAATIDGKTYNLEMDTFRDHSFGHQREWRNFHRYGLHFITLENGDRITIDAICMPICMSCLYVGFVYSEKDKNIFPITDCDLELYQHGENGIPPIDYAFTFKAGGNTYMVQVDVIDTPFFYISKDWESKVVERLCKFKVNGIIGWGASEWQYRNINGNKVKHSI